MKNGKEINKAPETNKTKSQRLYIASAHLMKASEEIAPLAADLSKTFYNLADLLLKEINVEDKMEQTEMDDIMNNILSSTDGK